MHCQIVHDFELFLQSHLPQAKSFHPNYDEALRYMIQAGGKRFRPYLLLNLVKHYNPLLVENAYYVAAGVEMLHTYSLIHDDLPMMDNARLRRGKETLHVKYDQVVALLVGDALNTHAFYMLSVAPLDDSIKIQLIQSLAVNAGVSGMVLGQAIDCAFENKNIAYEELKFLHVNKTAKLIASCLQMGAIVGSANKKEIKEWYEFGLELGLLFQIQDDIIDVTHDEEKARKTINNDINKNTYVNILGLEGAKKQKNMLLDALQIKLQNVKKPLYEEFSGMLTRYFKEK